MQSLLLEHRDDIYGAVFYGSLALFAIAEFLLPFLAQRHAVGRRWLTNFTLGIGNMLLTGLIMPIGAVALALLVAEKGWGLFHVLNLPGWLSVPLGILLLDFAKYAEHVLMHRLPLLWRAHVVHHADLDIDFTTGLRHHPLEALVGAVTLPLVIVLFGAPALSVVAFQVLATAAALYTHANIRFHPALDRILRPILVTRDAHLVHHSAAVVETDSNYGLIFLIWDRLFGTYRAEAKGGPEGMTIGLDYFREPRELVIDRALTMPFRVPRSAPAPSPRERTRTVQPPA